jgi:hypothetical protein
LIDTLSAPRVEQAPHVLDAAHATAHRKGNEHPRSDGLDHMQQDVALVGARGDVQECELVRALAVVARGDLDRIAGVAQGDEVDALYHPPRGHVEAGDDTFG